MNAYERMTKVRSFVGPSGSGSSATLVYLRTCSATLTCPLPEATSI